MTEAEQPITQMLDAYKKAVHAKDVDAFVALYDQNVCVFDMWGRWSYDGVDAWRGMVENWFDSLGTERVAVDMDEVRTIEAGDVAVAHAYVTYKGLSADDEELRAMTNRLTWVLKKTGGEWKIVHEHTSAPVDLQTSKVILQR